jgi:hypothetical protein
MWDVDPLPRNAREISKYITAIQLHKKACLNSKNWIQQQKNGVRCAACAEML